MFSVFKHECKAYLNNLYGFIFMALLLCGVNALLAISIINTQQSGIEYVLYGGSYVLIVAVPLLSMRSMAEDRRRGVDRLWRSLPLSDGAVVMGKYLALLAVLAIPTAVFALYPVILGLFTTVEYGSVYLSLLLFFLVGAALLALCQFISGLTKNPLLAGGISLLASAVLCLLPLLERVLPDGIFISVVQNISPIYHMKDAARYGILNLRSVAVLFLYIVLFLFLTFLVRGIRRPHTAVVGATLLAIVIAANVVLPLCPFTVTELRTDRDNLVNIPPETKELLEEVDKDVTLYWLCENDEVDEPLLADWYDRMLNRYEALNPHITVRKITDPDDIKSWEELDVYNYDLIVSTGERLRVVSATELFGYASTVVNQMYGGQEMVFSAEEMSQVIQSLLSSYPEQQEEIQKSMYITCVIHAELTAALDYVTADETPRPYILTGVAGAALPSGLETLLSEYDPDELTELDISRVDAIPSDAGCVILHSPLTDLDERETAILDEYLSAGGSLVLTTAPALWGEDASRLQSLLTPYGLTALPGIVFESDPSYYVSSTDTLVPQVSQQHPVYYVYASDKNHRMPWSHAIGISTNATAIPLFATSSSAVRKPAGGTNETLGNPTQYALAVHAMREVEGGATSQVIWFGSADAFTDTVAASATANYAYYLEAIEQLRGEYVSPYATIPGVSLTTEAMEKPSAAMSIVLVLMLTVLLPLALLLVGVVLWYKRRRRA